MIKQKDLEKINYIVEKSKTLKRTGSLKNHPDFNLIIKITNYLPIDSSVSRRLYHIINTYDKIPKCKMCDNNAPWDKHGHYRIYCSPKCAHNDPVVIEKTKQTNLRKYGSSTPMQNKSIRKNIVEKWKNNLGVDNPSKSIKIKERKRNTTLKNWGVDVPLKNKKIQDKIKQTNLEKYGHENVFSNKKIQDKIKQTNLEKYGVEYPIQSMEIQDKIKQTNLEKYGAEHVWCAGTTVRKKQQKTMMDRYNSLSVYHLPANVIERLNNPEWLYKIHHMKKMTLGEIGHVLDTSGDTVGKYCRKHDIKIITRPASVSEKEIFNFINQELNINAIENSRKVIPPYELDIYIPEHNLAIEYNGLFWHSEAGHKDANYHLLKTEMCESKGIRLIHIFEDEWHEQQQKCKETITHLLGKSRKGVFARNTIIREISWKQAKNFLNQYHLLNAGTSGNYRIGAFDKDNNLIGVMVFGNINNEFGGDGIELKRFVTNKKNNPGLGSKMFKYAVNNKQYTSIIAYVDRRWFTGLVKEHIGFNIIGVSKPSIWWTNGYVRTHRRFKTKKQLISEGGNPKLSKRELLKDKGYVRIWDCGKIKLQWELES